ncbi:uncharacterized protein LOC116252117 isoform X3 [Nymphaea colorata]|uniref:uncharacterized protein LOC116252117 isoform X2 n=1 Tax=Nymphaea colorata TaxID=210225 RepID=UPI00129ECA35|nr:uncharacterized protein LOC116252117 isoform X2 [Nymphaea colorata]XP_049931529.1 uncharacterized protein LOC116252117 isoform X3 [Nymphaea colorata]
MIEERRNQYLFRGKTQRMKKECVKKISVILYHRACLFLVTQVKQDWQHYLKSIRKGKKTGPRGNPATSNPLANDEFVNKSGSDCNVYDENTEKGHAKEIRPSKASTSNMMIPSTVLKQLATALEKGNNFKSMMDIMTSTAEPSQINDKLVFVPSFSVVKSLVLRDKDGKSFPEISFDEVASYIQQLFGTEPLHESKVAYGPLNQSMTYLPREIHGAPPGSFVVRLSEIMGSIRCLQKMGLFWMAIIAELRRFWSEGQPVPLLPLDETPDLNFCLLHQHLQAVNCCIARKRRRFEAITSLQCTMENLNADSDNLVVSSSTICSNSSALFARLSNGNLILRLGAAHPSQDLTLLETGEPMYSPVTQEGPIFTEDLIRENEEFVIRTGSVGAACSQLLSDMQSFKAANPGCILEDFVRWHSPPDWIECESNTSTGNTSDGEAKCKQGQLSIRMKKEGNLWRELWENAKPVPAVNQAPLYDEDLAVDGIFNLLEEIAPADIFQQLLVAALSAGFAIAETAIPIDSESANLFNESKQYVISTCQYELNSENIDNLCQVYATVETLLAHPEAAITTKKPDNRINSELKRRFEKFNLNFPGKNKPFFGKPSGKDKGLTSDDSQPRRLAHFFDPRSSLFMKKSAHASAPAAAASAAEPLSSDENEWTIV